MRRQKYAGSKDTYATRLAARMKDKRQEKSTPKSAETGQVEVEARPDSHPDRYPKHPDPNKGQVFNGVCNTTRCDSHRAVFYNRGTFGLYCPTCGRGQNGNDPVPISVIVEEKPSIARMNEMRAELYAQLSAQREKDRKRAG